MVLPFKDKELNKVAAFFNLCTFLLTCAALIQPSWFKIRAQSCKTGEIETLMHILILLCFMVLLCSLMGVLINLTSLDSKPIKLLRRNAVPSIMCVFWVIAIVGVCYYTTLILGSENSDSQVIQVDYEYGFYMITAAGALALSASAANLWGAPMPNEEDIQRRNLIDDWDGYDPHGVGPAPEVPSLPPYTPHPTNFASSNRSSYLPPSLGARQYFPFDDLSILPPPPPYTP